jgi:predicted metal-dependent TIM-barrel fold hydrolase
MVERFGVERLCVNSACDWGPSVPIAVPQLIQMMKQCGHSDALIQKLVYDNPRDFLGQSPHFDL